MRNRRIAPCLVILLTILVLGFSAVSVLGQGGTGKMPPPQRNPPPIRKMPAPTGNPPLPHIPELKISERQMAALLNDDVVILDLAGKISAGESSTILRAAIRHQLGKGRKNILLNLSKVTSLDSNGIAELVSSRDSIKKEGGQMKLFNLSKKVRDQLASAKLLATFDVYANELDAVASAHGLSFLEKRTMHLRGFAA